MRFAGTTGVEVAHNLTDAAITARNGATPILVENETGALPAWFVNEATADLRLTPAATAAIARVPRRADAADDFSALVRSAPPGLTALGAHEFAPDRIFGNGFE
ncbi:MAG TPA: hypothetical protein PKZ76_14940 [Xanthomonadaceae bacterium]|nr:hypothetical protein [Xanthomonadaceae bacterium]